MTILELRILPPMAFARLGSAAEPVDNYTVEVDPDRGLGLGYRKIKPAATLIVDEASGEIAEARIPETVTFKQDGHIRPVAPFLEVFALTGKNKLVPLSLELLQQLGLGPANISWRVVVANRKIVRRTNDPNDAIAAEAKWFSGHEPQPLKGKCKNFISPDKFVDFGHVRYIKPNARFPGIRLRFAPAHGLIYGPKLKKKDSNIAAARAIYDTTKGSWYHYEVKPGADAGSGRKPPFQNETLPPSLFAIEPPAPSWLHDNKAVSRGYFDDACDGFVEVALALPGGKSLTARSRIAAAPPLVVPDSFMVRTLADELDQIVHGPTVSDAEPPEVTRARAEDIIRRSYDTLSFLNVAVMNGCDVPVKRGDVSVEMRAEEIDTMPAEEAFDSDRMMRPVFPKDASHLPQKVKGRVDTAKALKQHATAFEWVQKGNSHLLLPYLRKPDEVADYTDKGRRKMPALMCGADNNYLALTHRQIDTLRKTANGLRTDELGKAPAGQQTGVPPAGHAPQLSPRNISAQLHYEGAGNPASVGPAASVGNCIPGLELDFRAVWRRLFEGIVLREYDNLVVDVDPALRDKRKRELKYHRLLRVAGVPVVTQMRGPSAEHLEAPYEKSPLITTEKNPHAVAPLEWSNALAHVLRKYQGKKVRCDFTREESRRQQQPWRDDPASYVSFDFFVRPFFEDDTAVISRALADAGELTQGLCSPWQNDYRECSCYYWASARPDFVNVEQKEDGSSIGDNWLQKKRTKDYVPDDYADELLILFQDILSPDWEQWFRFQVGGRDVEDAGGSAGETPVAPTALPAGKADGRKSGKKSFERDIRPLFKDIDMQMMGERNVFLADYDFMKVPANAKMVLAYLSAERIPTMPLGPPWPAEDVQKFRDWINDGLKP